jgi:hypothetical protein
MVSVSGAGGRATRPGAPWTSLCQAERLLLGASQRASRHEAGFGQRLGGTPGGADALGRTSRCDLGRDEQRPGRLAQRVLGDESLHRSDRVARPSSSHVELGDELQCVESDGVEPGRLGAGRRRVGDVAERPSVPRRQRVSQASARLPVVVVPLDRPPAAGDGGVELGHVGGVGVPEHEPERTGRGRNPVSDESSEPRHLRPQGADGRRRRRLAPHGVAQRVDRHGHARVGEQRPEDDALGAAPDVVPVAVVVHDPDAPERLEPHRTSVRERAEPIGVCSRAAHVEPQVSGNVAAAESSTWKT